LCLRASSGLYTNIGQVGSSKIATAIVDITDCTHKEHGGSTNGVESLERRDPLKRHA